MSVSAVDSTPVDDATVNSAAADSPAVDISGLVKRYASVTAVDGLTLRAPRGEITALLGPNGAGKTTTVEICEGYRRADAGTVRVLGYDPVKDARVLRARVGVMPQTGGLPPGARAGEYLRLMASFHAEPADPAALLDRLGLTSSARTPLRRLSGGQQQRLSLAAAIVGRPELLFLDEPTAGLDPQARHATWDLIAELRSVGVSIVLTTHLMDEAERLADSVAIIDHGHLITAGTPASLTGKRQQLRLRARPGLDLSGLAAVLPAGSTATESPAGNYVIDSRELSAGAPELLGAVATWCRAHQVEADDLRIASRTLEDVFLELTGRELRS